MGTPPSHGPDSGRSGRTISHYEVGDLLGTGGMGEVYRATDTRLRRRVAMKFLHRFSDPAMRQRLIHEAQSASLLDHPNICTIFEVDETGAGDVFIVMAYYDGETLDCTLRRGPLAVAHAVAIAVHKGLIKTPSAGT